MMAVPAFVAAMPSAIMSFLEIGIAGWHSRVHAPLSAHSIQTFGILRAAIERLDLPDHARDNREAALPEIRIARVEPERFEQIGMVLGAAGGKHREIAVGETAFGFLVDRVK